MLQGFGITGFRSFGPEPQFLYPLQKVNLIVGRNNAGKSNVLRAVQQFERFTHQPKRFMPPAGLDAHVGARSARFTWRLPLRVNNEGISDLTESLFSDEQKRRQWEPLVRCILDTFPDRSNDAVWITYERTDDWKPLLPDPLKTLDAVSQIWKSGDLRGRWYGMWSALTNQSGGSFEQHHGPGVLARLVGTVTPQTPKVSFLSAHRQIGAPGTSYDGLDGKGLIARLLELQNPELAARNDALQRFESINRFVSEVLEAKGARLEVPHSGKELNVSIRGRVLPIESLGTGVQQVIIFAAAAASVEDEIVCIEEPEVHLHPRLQRQLLSYLQEHTSNQYMIATHSACLLDAPDAAVFHVALNHYDETEVRCLRFPSHRASAVLDLGYRASDLVQANAIVWVEGPSDRIYINAWINSLAPELIEGLHYSVMFYGGRLLSHLSATDSSVTQFIALQRLNRHVAVLVDSDRRRAKDPLNETKDRVLGEVEESGGFCWVTAGREVENYLSIETVSRCLSAVHPRTSFKVARSQWDCCYEASETKGFSADKVALARAAVAEVNLDVLDLRVKVEGLIEFLRGANR